MFCRWSWSSPGSASACVVNPPAPVQQTNISGPQCRVQQQPDCLYMLSLHVVSSLYMLSLVSMSFVTSLSLSSLSPFCVETVILPYCIFLICDLWPGIQSGPRDSSRLLSHSVTRGLLPSGPLCILLSYCCCQSEILPAWTKHSKWWKWEVPAHKGRRKSCPVQGECNVLPMFTFSFHCLYLQSTSLWQLLLFLVRPLSCPSFLLCLVSLASCASSRPLGCVCVLVSVCVCKCACLCVCVCVRVPVCTCVWRRLQGVE